MTNKEIIKALECCKKDDCDNCPNDFGNCCANLAGCSLDLITRQRAEIEMTDNEIIKYLEQAIDKYNKNEIFVDNIRPDKLSLDLINRQQAEIERLKAFKSYFDELYGKGLDVANWHLNSELEPFDNFFESALQEVVGEE